jgi:hypothetical protein
MFKNLHNTSRRKMTRASVWVAALTITSQSAWAGVFYNVSSAQLVSVAADGRSGIEGYVLQYATLFPGDTGCTSRDFAYIRKIDPLAKEMYAAALAALLAGKTIKVYTSGCDSIGNVINYIAVLP